MVLPLRSAFDGSQNVGLCFSLLAALYVWSLKLIPQLPLLVAAGRWLREREFIMLVSSALIVQL